MAVTFRGKNLFASGPHRVQYPERGQLLQLGSRILGFNELDGRVAIGNVEIELLVTGRLTAATEPALWTLRDAIIAESDFDLSPADLVDAGGRTWTDQRLVRYIEDGPAAQGRVWSVGYQAQFIRLRHDIDPFPF